MPNVSWFFPFLSALLLLPGLAAPGGAAAQGSPEAQVRLSAAQVSNLRLATVQRHVFQPRLEAVGSIDFNQDRVVALLPAVSGRVRRVPVAVGAAVRAGQVVLELDSPELAQAEAAWRAARAVAAHARSVLARSAQLAAAGTLAQKDLEQARSDAETSGLAEQAAREALRLSGLDDGDVAQLEDGSTPAGVYRLRAPQAGRVITRTVAVGTLAGPQMATPPLTLADAGTVWLVAQVAETDIAHLQLGAAVDATVPAYPGRHFQGRVSTLQAALDPATHRLAVRTELADPGGLLRPQMLAHVTLATAAPHRALAVPADAVVHEGDGSLSVWVTRTANLFERRGVTLGLSDGALVEVLGGLAAGDTVVSEGGLYLSNAHALVAP